MFPVNARTLRTKVQNDNQLVFLCVNEKERFLNEKSAKTQILADNLKKCNIKHNPKIMMILKSYDYIMMISRYRKFILIVFNPYI